MIYRVRNPLGNNESQQQEVTMDLENVQLMPPVGPYSPPDAIRTWVLELHAMAGTADVQARIDEANKWLEIQQSYISIA